jgi:hypothetical protein
MIIFSEAVGQTFLLQLQITRCGVDIVVCYTKMVNATSHGSNKEESYVLNTE